MPWEMKDVSLLSKKNSTNLKKTMYVILSHVLKIKKA